MMITQEYRTCNNYWINRFTWHEYHGKVDMAELIYGNKDYFRRNIDVIKFTNGYGNKVPYLIIELDNISVGNGNERWGFENTCFVLKLGKIIGTGHLIASPI